MSSRSGSVQKMDTWSSFGMVVNRGVIMRRLYSLLLGKAVQSSLRTSARLDKRDITGA